MKRFFRHPITQMAIGWTVFFAIWLVFPADPPYVDATVSGARHDTRS